MTDPFGLPGHVPDRQDVNPFGVPSDSGRATRTGDAEDRAKVPRDQWGRYLLPTEDGGKRAPNKGLTRVSTTKAALSNTIGIQKWSGRRIVQGLAMNPDAVAAAMRAAVMEPGPDQEKAFGQIAEGAFQTGGGKERAGLGTEFHEITEERNRGELKVENLDPKWNADLAAYEKLLSDNDIEVLPEYLERQVLCPFHQAGTFDNMVRYWNPDTEEYELLIADLKTGRKLDLGWLEILIQLWSYANAYALWTTTKVLREDRKDPSKITDIEGFYEPMPHELRTDKALIFHCPLDGTATLYVLDLSGVERYARAAVEAKRANAEAKLKVREISTVRPDAFTAPTGPVNVIQSLSPISAGVVQTTATGTQTASEVQYTATTQMQTDAAKAADRQQLAAESIARAQASTSTSKPQSAVDPVSGRKKRACGYCREPGHTQKTCPENPNSPKFDPSPDAVQPIPAGEPAPGTCNCLHDGDWHPIGSGGCVLSPDAVQPIAGPVTSVALSDPGDMPYCTNEHVCQWTSQHPDAPNQWVCSISGKPGKTAWERDQTQVTAEPPFYGQPQPADLSTRRGAMANPYAEPPTPMMPIPDQIAAADTPNEVLQIRGYNIDANNWSPEYEELGRLRYLELTT